MQLSANIIIIIITGLVSYRAFGNPMLAQKTVFNPYRVINHNEWYRLISLGLVHANWPHLIFNMLTFYFFAPPLEHFAISIFGNIGVLYFVGFYLVGIIVSSLPDLIAHRHNPAYNSLGASGGVSAVVFGFVALAPTQPICLYFVLCLPGFIMASIYLIYSWYQAKKSDDNINHMAHFVGAAYGLAGIFVFVPSSFRIFIEQIANYKMF